MKPRVRCRHGGRPTDLVPSKGPNKSTRHPASAVALRGAALAFLAAAASGCSVSFPISGIRADESPTGSIDRTVAILPPSLDREDLRRAKAAMAVALDPQGNGARSGWQNSQTGAHGAFTAEAAPFTDRDRVCRRFSGEVTAAGGSERRLSGSACREGDGSWVMRPAETGPA